jgi:thioredoxin reductase (NADPH)
MRKGTPISVEVVIIGGGLAGLSAAIYLGRAKRDALLIDDGKSMARWEPDVQNYLGFPAGISGEKLLHAGREQARRYGIRFGRDRIRSGKTGRGEFKLRGDRSIYQCRKLLLATGIFHLPPEIPHVSACLGHSIFFCKDCDGYRVQGKSVAIYGWNNEAVEYALAMLCYSGSVAVVTDGRAPKWDRRHDQWLSEYKIPVHRDAIVDACHQKRHLQHLMFKGGSKLLVDALFTTRGDIYLNELAKELGAKLDDEGQIIVDVDMRTSRPGLYAAGCVTPANCQMIVAAGQGATAAQTINRDLFDENLANHSLRRCREGTRIQKRALKR